MTSNNPSLYPLRFREIIRTYGFGERWIVESFDKPGLPAEGRIAETWEAVDRPGESSEVINGALEGETLHELIERYGADLLGSDIMERYDGRFPLLIKLLDASNVLGEQIHPTDEQAREMHPSDPGKTEAWYMIKTREGASIHCGNKPGVTREDVIEALDNENSLDLMSEHPVQPGDSFLLYANTMHYSKGGALFYEIMQNSDITVGLNWVKNAPRPEFAIGVERAADMIHLEEGFDCRTQHLTLSQGDNERVFIMACRHFCVERLDLGETYALELDGSRFYVLTQLEGTSKLGADDYTLELRPGQSCLLPARLGEVTIEPDGNASLLKSYVPDLKAFVALLRAQGVSDKEILGLGGATELNDLAPILEAKNN